MARSALVGCVVLALVSVALAPPSGSLGNHDAFYPTLSGGDRGTDVSTLQLLLLAAGQPLVPSGVFDAATRSAVVRFQMMSGLPPDGIAHPATWAALVTDVQFGDVGPAVLALQGQLDAKLEGATAPQRSASETASFGTGTMEQVRAFQTDVGLPVTGAVDAVTWRHLVWHYEYLDLQYPGSCHFWDTYDQWGKASMLGHLYAAIDRFSLRGRGAVPVGDMSDHHGGPLANHTSHQVGLDVDLGLIRVDGTQCGIDCTIDDACYDQAGTRALIDDLVGAANGHIVRIYFEDPDLLNYQGVVRDAGGHRNHLHVRYCAPNHPDVRYDDCPGVAPLVGIPSHL